MQRIGQDHAAFKGEAPRDEIERREIEQAAFLASLEDDDNVVIGPAEWFKGLSWIPVWGLAGARYRRQLELEAYRKKHGAASGLPTGMVMQANTLDDDGCSDGLDDEDDADANGSKAPPNGMFARYARLYRDLGYSPIYVKSVEGKWPKDWPKYCHEAATPEEIEKWGGYVPSHNVALATGYRGLVAIDVDTSDAAIHAAILKALPHCRVARFGSKGFALLCQYHRFEPTKFKNIYAPKDKDGNRQVLVEIKGDGQNITVPPSIHRHTGSAYVWINPETGEALADQQCPPLDDLPLLTDADIERLRKALEPWAEKPRVNEPPPKDKAAKASRTRLEKWYRAALANARSKLSGLTCNRPTELFNSACSIGAGVHHGIITRSEFESALLDGCEINGLIKRDGRKAIEASIASGLRWAENDELPDLGEPRTGRLKDRGKPNGHDPEDGATAAKGGGGGNNSGGNSTGAPTGQGPQPQQHGKKPQLEIVKADPDQTTARVRDLLAGAGCFFERGVPVQLASDKSLGGLVAHVVTPEIVILETHERSRPFMTVITKDGPQEINIQLPKNNATMYLRWLGKWQLPVLNGITSAPQLLNSGEIRTAAGYDEMTGLWFQRVPDVAALVPEHPTEAEAKEALRVIRCLFQTFCFADASTITEGVLKCVDPAAPIGLDEFELPECLADGGLPSKPGTGTGCAGDRAPDIRFRRGQGFAYARDLRDRIRGAAFRLYGWTNSRRDRKTHRR